MEYIKRGSEKYKDLLFEYLGEKGYSDRIDGNAKFEESFDSEYITFID